MIDNVLIGRLGHLQGWPRWAALVHHFDADQRAIALRCLDHVGLLDRVWQRTDTLSGGEQQRVAIAKILAQEPTVVLADEPVASLDLSNGRLVMQTLRRVASAVGITVVATLHHVDTRGSTPTGFSASRLAGSSSMAGHAAHRRGAVRNLRRIRDGARRGRRGRVTRENRVPRGTLRVIWVSKLIPNDPIVVRKDLPASFKSAVRESLTSMRARSPEVFREVGASVGGFVAAADGKYQVIRELNETAKRLAGQK